MQKLVNDGKTLKEIGEIFSKGTTTIRYWLKKFGIKNPNKRGPKPENLIDGEYKLCSNCKIIKHANLFFKRINRNGHTGYCKECITEITVKRGHKIKDTAIEYLGGKCKKCNGKFPRSAFSFHHRDPKCKDFVIGHHQNRLFELLKEELDKCDLLCENCHSETHHELKQAEGYSNNINGNTELWRKNRLKKLHIISSGANPKCQYCGYCRYVGSLIILFPEEYKHLRKYNKTIFDDWYIEILKESDIICKNCFRIASSVDAHLLNASTK